MSDLFHIIEGAVAVLRQRGVFRQVAVYRRGNALYARWGSGFIQLRGSQGTTLPDCMWEALELPPDMEMAEASFGVPMIAPSEPKQIAAPKKAKDA